MVPRLFMTPASIALPFSFLCGARPSLTPCSSRARHENGKARPAAESGRNFDSVAQNSNRLPHDEESDTQSIAWYGVKAGEGLEHPGHLFARNSDSRVIHVDPNTRTDVPAAKKDPTSWLGVLDCVTEQIAQGGTEQQAVA